MREIKVLEGNRCWLVCLTDPEPWKGQILERFPWGWNEDPQKALQDANLWAAGLLKDLAAQRDAYTR